MQRKTSESDPRLRTANLRRMLTGVIDPAREDVDKISDPKAQALFETTAEVLIGLRKAFEGYERASEAAWKRTA